MTIQTVVIEPPGRLNLPKFSDLWRRFLEPVSLTFLACYLFCPHNPVFLHYFDRHIELLG